MDERFQCLLINVIFYTVTGFGLLAYILRPGWFRRYKKVGHVSDIILYPVVSCDGTSVKECVCGHGGLEKGGYRDREFVVVDNGYQYYSPNLARVKPICDGKNLLLSAPGMSNIRLSVVSRNLVKFSLPSPWSETNLSPFSLTGHPVYLNGCGQFEEVVDCGKEVGDWLKSFLHPKGKSNYQLCRRNDMMRWRAQRQFGEEDMTSFEKELENIFTDFDLSDFEEMKFSSDEESRKNKKKSRSYKDKKKKTMLKRRNDNNDFRDNGANGHSWRHPFKFHRKGGINSCMTFRRSNVKRIARKKYVRNGSGRNGAGLVRSYRSDSVGAGSCCSSGHLTFGTGGAVRRRSGCGPCDGVGRGSDYPPVCVGSGSQRSFGHVVAAAGGGHRRHDHLSRCRDASGGSCDQDGVIDGSVGSGGSSNKDGPCEYGVCDGSVHRGSQPGFGGGACSDIGSGVISVGFSRCSRGMEDDNRNAYGTKIPPGFQEQDPSPETSNGLAAVDNAFSFGPYRNGSDDENDTNVDNNDDNDDGLGDNDDDDDDDNDDDDDDEDDSTTMYSESSESLPRQGVITVHTEATMNAVNEMMDVKPPMDAGYFRANIVISGCREFAELDWEMLRIGKMAKLKIQGPDRRCLEPFHNKEKNLYRSEIEPLPSLYDKCCIPGVSPAPLVGIKTTVVTEGRVQVGDPVYALDLRPAFG